MLVTPPGFELGTSSTPSKNHTVGSRATSLVNGYALSVTLTLDNTAFGRTILG